MKKGTAKAYIVNELCLYSDSENLFTQFKNNRNLRKLFAHAIFLDSTILRNSGEYSQARNVLAHTKSAAFLNDIAIKEFWAYCQDYFSDTPMSCDDSSNPKWIKQLESISECDRIQQLLSIMSELIELLNIDNPSIAQQAAILVSCIQLGEIQFQSPLIGTRQHKLDDLKKYNKNISHILGKFQNIRDALAHPDVQADLTYEVFIQHQFSHYKRDLNALLDCMKAAKQAVTCYYEDLTEVSLKKASQTLATTAKFLVIKEKLQLLTKQYNNLCEMFFWAKDELSSHIANLSDDEFSEDWKKIDEVIPSLANQFDMLKNKIILKKIKDFESALEETMLNTFVFIYKGYIKGIASDLSILQKILDKNTFFLQKSWNAYTKNKRNSLLGKDKLVFSVCPLMSLSLNSFASNPELTRYIFMLQKKCYRKTNSTQRDLGNNYLFGFLMYIARQFGVGDNIKTKEKSLGYFFDIFHTDLNRLPFSTSWSYPGIFVSDPSNSMLKIFIEKYPSELNKQFKLTHNSRNDSFSLTRIKEDRRLTFFNMVMNPYISKQDRRSKLDLLLSHPDFCPLVLLKYHHSGRFWKKMEVFGTIVINDPDLFDDSLYVLKKLLDNIKLKDQCQEMLHVYLYYLCMAYGENSSPDFSAIHDLNYIEKSFHIILTHDNFDPTYIRDEASHILKNFWHNKDIFFELTLSSFFKRDPSGKLLKTQLEFEVPIIIPSDIMCKNETSHNLSCRASINREKLLYQKILDTCAPPSGDKLKGDYAKDYARSHALNSTTSAAKYYGSTKDGEIIIKGVTIGSTEESNIPSLKKRMELIDKVYANVCELVKIPEDIEKLKGLIAKLQNSEEQKLHALFSQKIETLKERLKILPKELDSILAVPSSEAEEQPSQGGVSYANF